MTCSQGDLDRAVGIEATLAFERFAQRNDIFKPVFWDPSVRSPQTAVFVASYRMAAIPRRGEGFSRRDLALLNAA